MKNKHLFRYDEDIHDRVWNPISDDGSLSISTDLEVQTNNFYDVPQAVMRTAAIPKNASAPWSLVWTIENTTVICIYAFRRNSESKSK